MTTFIFSYNFFFDFNYDGIIFEALFISMLPLISMFHYSVSPATLFLYRKLFFSVDRKKLLNLHFWLVGGGVCWLVTQSEEKNWFFSEGNPIKEI